MKSICEMRGFDSLLVGVILLFTLVIPVTAVTLVDLELVSSTREYDSDYPVEYISDTFKIKKEGWMTVTWQVDPYYPGFKTTRTRGGGTYYPQDLGNDYLGPECQVTQTPAEDGQPYKKVWKCYVNNPQGDRIWVAKLGAPSECEAFHICHEGMQFKAKQRYKIEFES